MSEATAPCARFSHIDPLAYLVDREAGEFAEWRTHFPGCPECSAALAALSALEWQLGELGDAHPEAPELNAFALGHGLDESQLEKIEAHVASCPMCSDQLRALERFEAATAGARAVDGTHGGAEGSLVAGFSETIRRLLESVPAPVWAGAIALLLFAAYAVVNGLGAAPEGESTSSPQLAQQNDTASEEPIAPSREPPGPVRIETLPTPEVVAERDSGPTEPESPNPSPERMDGREGAKEIDEGMLAEEATRSSEREPAEILLASLDLPGVLDYRAADLGRGRLDMLGRGAAMSPNAGPPIQVLAPQTGKGRSVTTGAVLAWSLPQGSVQSVRLTIVDDRQIDPVFEKRIEGPHTAGLHGLDLASHGVELEPGIDYVWSISLEVDPDRPSRSPRSQAVLGLVGEQGEAAEQVAEAGPKGRIEAALTRGFWYDGVSDLARAAASSRADAGAFASALRELAIGQGVVVSSEATVTLHGP